MLIGIERLTSEEVREIRAGCEAAAKAATAADLVRKAAGRKAARAAERAKS